MAALAISNSHRIHKKSLGRVTRFSADSARALNHLNAFNCPADDAASSCSALRIMPSMIFLFAVYLGNSLRPFERFQ